jgi:hypothetical protein
MDKEEAFKLYMSWIDLIQREGKNLSDWEHSFVQSLKRQLREGRNLSDKQVSILEKIYADKTP